MLFAMSTNAQLLDCSELFISEYIEGSGQTRAIEVYNPTSAPINLLGFELWIINNGGDWLEGSETNYIFPEWVLDPDAVFVFCGSDLSDQCDYIENLPFSGNDAVGLVEGPGNFRHMTPSGHTVSAAGSSSASNDRQRRSVRSVVQ